MSSKKQRNAGTYAASKLPFFCEKAENEQNITRYKNEKNSLWAPKLLWRLDDFEGKFLATRKCWIGLRKIRNYKKKLAGALTIIWWRNKHSKFPQI